VEAPNEKRWVSPPVQGGLWNILEAEARPSGALVSPSSSVFPDIRKRFCAVPGESDESALTMGPSSSASAEELSEESEDDDVDDELDKSIRFFRSLASVSSERSSGCCEATTLRK
jgi:hypothetical protein